MNCFFFASSRNLTAYDLDEITAASSFASPSFWLAFPSAPLVLLPPLPLLLPAALRHPKHTPFVLMLLRPIFVPTVAFNKRRRLPLLRITSLHRGLFACGVVPLDAASCCSSFSVVFGNCLLILISPPPRSCHTPARSPPYTNINNMRHVSFVVQTS